MTFLVIAPQYTGYSPETTRTLPRPMKNLLKFDFSLLRGVHLQLIPLN